MNKAKPIRESLTGIGICQLALPFPALTHSAPCWPSLELPSHCRKFEEKNFHSIRHGLIPSYKKNLFLHTCAFGHTSSPSVCIGSMLFSSRWKYSISTQWALADSNSLFFPLVCQDWKTQYLGIPGLSISQISSIQELSWSIWQPLSL